LAKITSVPAVALALVITKSLKVDFAVALAVRVVPEADMPVVVPDPLHVPLLRVNVYVSDPVETTVTVSLLFSVSVMVVPLPA